MLPPYEREAPVRAKWFTYEMIRPRGIPKWRGDK